ncbi:BadF/BadG/BcrA/BcrD ATPase family protein [Microvirga sp. 17 mud 1-3]|uniref:BadF/BadG/BcrA/BcrD ATPase family protein n=1 Tax=Microvirga sp. 17 mud 1-3 TaxID=2082949 RepID=UPI000D6B474C|nr:BadF/BadG/BcrA/BcrD ATPase family protein [Microvirga sp. 17 mud 1-3]AWM85828.1 N-acetylglucosamine kinase [Microvirga sp. 17 mud 1-3]
MIDSLFLGIDGGGTKCRARLRDAAGNLLGEGTGGPSNIRLDPDLVWNAILTACRAALDQARLGEADLGRIHAGMGAAGAGQSSAVERLMARPHPFASFAIDTDAHTAWLGAFSGNDGAILIVGTGSCGYGVVGGERRYVGGWGYEISDEGSGAAIGREALRRTIWAYDGRIPQSALSQAILAEFDHSPEAIVDWVGKARPADYARYAPIALQHALQRDPLGLDLITDAAHQMAQIATRLLDLGAPALCLFGGLAEPLRPWLPPPLQQVIVPPQADALDGAILLARQATQEPLVRRRR